MTLAVLVHFFEHGHWSSPLECGVEDQSLTAEDQLFILMQAGLYLSATRGLGAPETQICFERVVIGAVLMGLVANSVFGIVPMYLARRFPPARRGIGVGIGYAMTSLSVGAPFVVALLTPVWGLAASMAFFIAVAALASAVIAAWNTEKWIPADVPQATPLTASGKTDG